MATQISDIRGTSAVGGGVTTTNSVQETKTQFLQLLLAQMQNQDPLNPQDTDQMTNQMMMLGQLEQQFITNESLGNLVNLQTANQVANFSSMIGKSALSKGQVLQIDGDNKGQISFHTSEVPSNTLVRVFDQSGNTVRTFEPEVKTVGLQEIAFNGRGLNNEELADGYYTFTVEALDSDGKALPVTTYSLGKISGVRLENGSPIFQLGYNDLAASDIERIY